MAAMQHLQSSAPKITFSIRIKQAVFLLFLLLKFKILRVPLFIAAIVLLPSNFWLLEVQSLAGNSDGQVSAQKIVDSERFTWNISVSHEGNILNKMDRLEKLATVNGWKPNWMKECRSRKSCSLDFYKKALDEVKVSKTAHVSYSSKVGHFVECFHMPEADLACPFLHQLMLRSLSKDGRLFRDVQFVSYTDTLDRELPKNQDVGVLPSKKRANTICERIESTGQMFYTFTVTLLYHLLIATAGCMVYFTASTIAFISGLKECGFLQLMFSNGLSVGAYWTVIITSVVVECAVFSAVIGPCYTLQCSDYFPAKRALQFGLVFFAYIYSMASLSLLLTVLLRTFYLIVVATVAIIMAMVSITVLGVINLTKMEEMDYILNTLLIFPPGHVVQYSLYTLYTFRSNEYMKWNNFQKDYLKTALTGMMAFPLVMTVLAIYLDFIISSGNGFRLPFTYIFSPSFWMPKEDAPKTALPMDFQEPEDPETIEPVPGGSPAVCVNDLSVSYERGCTPFRNRENFVQALDSFTCTIYRDQITALIGHNGAGKTTLIRALTGDLTPSSGAAYIGNRMVRDPYQCMTLRRIVSVCSQTNMLSQQLTVMESLKLAALSKGFTLESQLENVNKMLERLLLSGKENVRAVDLSGGQLRKLCCIISLMGDPEIILLDDPTRGLDPVSRRHLWQIMEERKQGRCLIMCTQFMDEADMLADRKVVISGGRLICAGSSLFLKNRFGCCPTINVSLRPERKAQAFVHTLPRGVTLINQSGTELQLNVSFAQSKAASELHLLAAVVKKLEWHRRRKGSPVAAFGVSQANLDDIFMRIKDLDTGFIVSGIRSRNLASMISISTKEEPPKRRMGDLALLRQNDLEVSQLRRSVCRTFASLMATNLRRQVRSSVQVICRFVMPLVLIAVVGILAYMEKNNYKLNHPMAKYLIWDISYNRSFKELIYTSTVQQIIAEAVRKPVVSLYSTDNVVCVYEKKGEEKVARIACKYLANYHFDVVRKGKESIGDFILPGQQLRPELENLCKEHCYIIYASSWSGTQSNGDRSFSIGQFWRKPRHEASEKPLASYFVKLWKLFASDEISPESVHMISVIPFLQYYSIQNELIVLVLLFSIIPVTFMSDPVEDRSTGVRQQMQIMGLSSFAYWVNTFVIHWIQYLTFAVLSILVCMIWDRYISAFLFCYVWLPLLLLGTVSNLLCIYCIGAMQRIPSNSVLAIYLFFILFVLSVVTFLMKSRIASAIAMWLVPPLAPMMLTFTALKIVVYGLLYHNEELTKEIPELRETFFNLSATVHALSAMGAHILLLIILLIITENWSAIKYFANARCASRNFAKRRQKRKLNEQDEKGVLMETERLLKNPRSNQNLLEVRNVEKVYPNGVYAVRGVTFGAMTGEIFGLLGQNGAGKTTLMSAIVGQLTASSGEVEVRHLGGVWLESHLGTQRGVVGFCPQHDPLFRQVTVEEHIIFYARIRGVPENTVMKQTDRLIQGLGLVDDRFKPAKQLSCGNKRSLCLAIALLGCPSVVVIDEASSGVDPENKRGIWRAIRGIALGGHRAVVVTTHSMEEVEALCSRLCVMDKGSMIGFGTVQQLRSQYGKDYTLDALLSATSSQDKLSKRKAELKSAIKKKFPHAILIDDVGASVQFRIPTPTTARLSARIQWLANMRDKLNVQYFSLYQMSLDQIFVKMMRKHTVANYADVEV